MEPTHLKYSTPSQDLSHEQITCTKTSKHMTRPSFTTKFTILIHTYVLWQCVDNAGQQISIVVITSLISQIFQIQKVLEFLILILLRHLFYTFFFLGKHSLICDNQNIFDSITFLDYFSLYCIQPCTELIHQLNGNIYHFYSILDTKYIGGLTNPTQ